MFILPGRRVAMSLVIAQRRPLEGALIWGNTILALIWNHYAPCIAAQFVRA
jgi:hypothetical protein